jgi:hypothetical protein
MENLRKVLLSCFLFTTLFSNAQLSNEQLAAIFEKEGQQITGETGRWTMLYQDVPVIAITDETANRMRIFTPIIKEKDIEEGGMKRMLEANFDSALDAKYCIFEGLVISVFTHSMDALTEEQLVDGMRQVVILADNYGKNYSSIDLISTNEFDKKITPKINQSPSKRGIKN